VKVSCHCRECGALVAADSHCAAHPSAIVDTIVSRSGTKWSEAEYARQGYGRVSLRLPADALDMLATKAESHGCSRAELVDAAIRAYRSK